MSSSALEQADVLDATQRQRTLGLVAPIWADVLEVDRVRPRDDFFKLGGNSLKACELMMRIRADLEISLDPLEIFAAPVLEDFAAVVTSVTEPEDAQPQSPGRKRKARLLPALVHHAGSGATALSCSQKAWRDSDPLYRLEQRIPLVRRLRGPLNVEMMQQAIDRLKIAHAILRTGYLVKDGALCPQVIEAQSDRLSVADPIDLPLAARNRRVWEMLHERYSTELRLEGQPLELGLFRMDEDDHYLAGFVCHLAFDATSVASFWRELFRYYRDGIRAAASDEPAQRIQFADFAVWERELLSPKQLALSDEFWRTRLAAAQPLRLPNAAQPMDKPSAWGVVPIGFAQAQCSALARFAAECGVTVPILLLGASAAILAHWTGQDRPVLGSVINGRPPALADAIGCFVQLRPFHVDLSADPSFAQLMELARSAYVETNTLCMPPPRYLLEDLQVARFLVNITSGDGDQPDSSEEGLGFVVTRRSLPNPLKTQVGRDISLSLSCGSNTLDGWIVYAAERFKHGEIQSLVKNLTSLVASGIAAPGERLSALWSSLKP